MLSEFLKQLTEKLKDAGLPMLETDVELLYKVLSSHAKTFDYQNAMISGLVGLLLPQLDAQAEKLIDKIDGIPG